MTLIVAVVVGTMLLSDDDDEPEAEPSEIVLEGATDPGADPFTRDVAQPVDLDEAAAAGTEPAGDDSGRIRAVGRIVNQLRHTFTGPGVLAWFHRQHPLLGQPPVDLLDDPLRYPEVFRAAAAARAMTA